MNSSTEVQATQEHCAFCFDIIKGTLEGTLKPNANPPLPESIPNVESPLFVTWHIDGDDLRGCIGTFAKEALEKNLAKYAKISAFQDSRFDPISKPELPRLSCAVSLLTNFEQAKDCYDWEVGKHGIEIEFEVKNRFLHGTFLPEVAAEQGWDKETTLKHLIRKAGYSGKLDDVASSIKLERYQSSKVNMTWEEYLQYRGLKK